ncbi:nitric oxide synthase, partial [Biomphalaria glabrata]
NPNFHLPTNKSLPILMIASGKGIAPFRSFWQHRTIEQEHYTKSAEDEREILGDMFLFFGCKSSALDNIYGKELKNMEKAGILSYYLAFSKELNLPKLYVQDLLRRRSAQVMDIVINKEGHIYVSGDVAKVNEITNALEELLVVDGLMSPDEAAKYIWLLK